MNAASYYDYQATARGLISATDVEVLTRLMSPIYGRLLRPWLPMDRDARIYEVACGPGIFLRFLKAEGYRNVVGSDSSPAQIALAQSSGASIVLGDSLQELKKQAADSFETIIGIDFIEHLPKDIFVEFLFECHRTLKPGGCLIMRAPNGDSPFVGRNLFNDITHYWAYTTIATQALLQMAGFKRVEFVDESLASIQHARWIKVPLMKISQVVLRLLIRSASREDVKYLSSSIYIAAWK
jgi:2-polyprenyl-3-methyl-5-hydroxy-6-metoxy-1,4-benzoquinol methylase